MREGPGNYPRIPGVKFTEESSDILEHLNDNNNADNDFETADRLFSERFRELLRYLPVLKSTDPRSYNEKNIEIRQLGLKGLSLAEIQGLIRDSDKSSWKEYPSYYHALIREFRDRITAKK